MLPYVNISSISKREFHYTQIVVLLFCLMWQNHQFRNAIFTTTLLWQCMRVGGPPPFNMRISACLLQRMLAAYPPFKVSHWRIVVCCNASCRRTAFPHRRWIYRVSACLLAAPAFYHYRYSAHNQYTTAICVWLSFTQLPYYTTIPGLHATICD